MDAECIAMIELALLRAGYSKKAAAADTGKDPSQFARDLGGGLLRLRDLIRLRPEFWTEFVPLLGTRYGLQVTSEDAATRAMTDLCDLMGRLARQMRPVSMSLNPTATRKDRVS